MIPSALALLFVCESFLLFLSSFFKGIFF